jgi:hypothetical protein
MGKRSRRSFDRFFILMVMISVGGWLLWDYGIPFIRGLIKPGIPPPPTVGPIVPAIDTQAIVNTIMTVVLWALCALVVVGLIWGLWKYRGKLFPPPSHGGLGETITNLFGGKTLYVNPQWTWNPKIMESDSASKLWASLWKFKTKRHPIEKGYHDKLYNWLKQYFPQAEYGKMIGGIRVDIAIDKIAIEVKGSRENTDFRSISEQALTRLNYYDNVIFALFAPKFTGNRFDEIEKAIKRDLPKVGVITYG